MVIPPFQVEQYLCENGVELRDYESVFEDIEGLASERTPAVKNVFDELSEKYNHTNGYRIDQSTAAEPVDGLEDRSNTSIEGQGGLIWIDPGTCSYAVYSRVPADRVVLQQSPLALAKALKVDQCLILS